MASFFQKIGKFIDAVSLWMAYTAAGGAFFLMSMMFIYVVLRKFGFPLPGAFQLSEQMVLVIVLLPAAFTAMERRHITLDVVTGKLTGMGKLSVELVGLLFALFMSAVIGYYGWLKAFDMFAIREYAASGTLRVPIWPFRFVVAIAFTMLGIQVIVVMVRVIGLIMGLKAGKAVSGVAVDSAEGAPS